MSPLAHCCAADYAEGGEVDDRALGAVGAGGLMAVLAAHPKTRHLVKRGVNTASLPLKRAMTKPVVATEAVAKQPLSEAESDALYSRALGEINHPFAKLLSERRQGAWKGDEGMQYNPLYTQELPRFLGPLSQNDEALKYAAMLGDKLDQQGVPLMRSMPQTFDMEEGSDALLTQPIPAGALRQLAEALGPDVVVSQQPSGSALIFSLGDKPLHDIREMVKKTIPDSSPRFAVSRPGKDRLVVTEDDWGEPNRTRSSILGQ